MLNLKTNSGDIMKKTTLPEYWYRIEYIAKKLSKNNNILVKADGKTEDIIEEYKQKKYLSKTPKEALNIPTYTMILFYKWLHQDVGKNTKSPVKRLKSSSWMFDTDFCFFNIRATNKEKNYTGNLIEAVKLLPIIRADGIHLAPFFDCAFDNLYAIDSINTITEKVINKKFLEEGITREEQLKFFIDCIHLLEKKAGFDLEPHTSQFSRVVLSYPEKFRWIKLNEKKDQLEDKLTQNQILKEKYQKKIVDEVNSIKKETMKNYDLKSLGENNTNLNNINLIKKCSGKIVEKLIEKGYWTIPNHIWDGVGLPEFKKYNKKENYPEFKYINWNNKDKSEHAFGLTTPYRFYDGLKVNEKPSDKDKELPSVNNDVIDFYSNIFLNMLYKYDFDFVRFDYVDHVFDSTYDDNEKIPISDRIIPYVLRKSIEKIRNKKPYVGTIAERMGNDIELYSSVGIDLLIGSDAFMDITKEHIEQIFEVGVKLDTLNQNEKQKGSILFAIDTHDTAQPLLMKKTPAERKGCAGMKLRFFLARFLNTSKDSRPKYECIGNQDMTSGLYSANNQAESLKWSDDKDFNNIYHNIEDLYLEYKEFIDTGKVQTYKIADEYFYWFIDNKKNSSRILCIVPLEQNEETKKKEEKNSEIKSINIFENFEILKNYKIEKISLDTKKKQNFYDEINNEHKINLDKIFYQDIIIFHIYK